MTSGISGVFVHVFSSSNDDKKNDEVVKQRVQLRELLEVATNHLKDCHYNQAKTIFVEAKTYLKNCKKRDEMKLPDELDFYINVVICYSFTMELDSVKDVTKEDFKKEDQKMKSEIDGLVKKYPKRHFPLFLRLLYSFKKECWREAIYYCELVQNFNVCAAEETKYKSTPIFSKHLIPELDIDYCNDVVHNIEEAAIYGLVEKVAKLDELKNPKASLAGFNWVNLWSKDCNEKIIKRLRSYKKPMNSFQLHKLFHTEILPRFYTLNKSVGKSLFCYYKKEFMYQCEECLRAKLQQESRNELFGRLCEHSSDENMSVDDSDLFDTDEDDDEDDLADTDNGGKSLLPPASQEKDKKDTGTSCDVKSDTKEVTEKEKVAKTSIKKSTKGQQTQTEKVKIGHRYVQTECSIKKKSIAVQTDGPKSKKQEKNEKPEKQEELKCSKCQDNTQLLSSLDEFKNHLSLYKSEVKESMQDQLYNILKEIKQIKEEQSYTKFQGCKNVDKSFEVLQAKDLIAKLEKKNLVIQEAFDKETKNLAEKNVFLQKLIVDQINDKYMMYKNIYSGLENNCRVIIANVTELQNLLTNNSIPNTKDNQSYLSRWEKTLLDLQRKNGQLKSFFKKTKFQMLQLSEYEFSDWPEIAEIPIEAFGFLFDSLKQNVKNVAVGGGSQQMPQNQSVMNQNPPPPPQNQQSQMPGCRMYPVAVVPQNIRPFMGTGLRYGTYQQPPPPIPMPPSKNQNNAQFPMWSPNSTPNEHIYNNQQANNSQWSNNPNMMAFFKSFNNTVNNDGNQKETLPINNSNFTKGDASSTENPANQEAPKPPENVGANGFWNLISMTSSLNKRNETSRSQNENSSAVPATSDAKQDNMDMNDYFSAYNDYETMSACNNTHAGNQGSKTSQAVKQTAANEQQRKNLIQNGFWALDHSDNKGEDKVSGKTTNHGTFDHKKVSNSQESEIACKSEASSVASSMENLSGKIIQRPVRPLSRLVNVCKEEDRQQYDAEKELFQYLRINCTDVDNDELITIILKVLKKFNGSFSNIPKTDILKEVRSLILSSKHGVWISPKSPLVDWEYDHGDTNCSICFDDLTQRPKCVLPCKHQYHKDCISQWLRTNSVCPICRVHSVIDEDYPPLS